MIINDDMGMMQEEELTVSSNMQHTDVSLLIFIK
jgi:hypothetical protein